MASTYDREQHLFKCHIKELLNNYYVPKAWTIVDDVEYITKEEYMVLTEDEKELYSTMSQTQLAKLTGIRAMGISQLVNLRQNSINIYHVSAIARALNIKDLSQILTIEYE